MKKIVLMMGIMIALLVVGVSAGADDVNLTNPQADDFGGKPLIMRFNVSGSTGDGGSVRLNMTNVTAYYRLSVDSAWTIIGSNNTNNLTEGTLGFDSDTLLDTEDYDFLLEVWSNQSGVGLLMASEITSNLNPDNHVPVCSQSTLSGDTTFDPSVTENVVVTATNASSCRVLFDANEFTMVESGDVCTFKLSLAPDSIYATTTFKTNDGTNNTDCTVLNNVQIKKSRPMGGLLNRISADDSIQADGVRAQATARLDSRFNLGNLADNPIIVVLMIIAVIAVISIAGDKKK